VCFLADIEHLLEQQFIGSLSGPAKVSTSTSLQTTGVMVGNVKLIWKRYLSYHGCGSMRVMLNYKSITHFQPHSESDNVFIQGKCY